MREVRRHGASRPRADGAPRRRGTAGRSGGVTGAPRPSSVGAVGRGADRVRGAWPCGLPRGPGGRYHLRHASSGVGSAVDRGARVLVRAGRRGRAAGVPDGGARSDGGHGDAGRVHGHGARGGRGARGGAGARGEGAGSGRWCESGAGRGNRRARARAAALAPLAPCTRAGPCAGLRLPGRVLAHGRVPVGARARGACRRSPPAAASGPPGDRWLRSAASALPFSAVACRTSSRRLMPCRAAVCARRDTLHQTLTGAAAAARTCGHAGRRRCRDRPTDVVAVGPQRRCRGARFVGG